MKKNIQERLDQQVLDTVTEVVGSEKVRGSIGAAISSQISSALKSDAGKRFDAAIEAKTADLRSLDPSKIVGRFASGDQWFQVGDTLIVWGQQTKMVEGVSQQFMFSFPRSFAAEPTVSISPSAISTGFIYPVYNSAVHVTGFEASVREGMDRVAKIPVVVSYIAIGRAGGLSESP